MPTLTAYTLAVLGNQTADAAFENLHTRGTHGKFARKLALKDVLKLDGRIPLERGETFHGSAFIEGTDNNLMPLALTHTTRGPELRIATGILDEDKGKWAGRNFGNTALLDEQGIGRLRASVDEMRGAGTAGLTRYDDLVKRSDALDVRIRDLRRKQYPSLDKEDIKELDALDRRVERKTVDLKYAIESQHDQTIKELDPAARAQWDRDQAEIDRLENASKDAFSRYMDSVNADAEDQSLWDQNVQLEHAADQAREKQAEHAAVALESGPKRGLGIPFRTQRIRERAVKRGNLERELWIEGRDREHLTGTPVPLSGEDQALLSSLEAEHSRIDQEISDLGDSGVVAQGVIPGDWNDLAYEVRISDQVTEDGSAVAEYDFDIKPHDAVNWHFNENETKTELTPATLKQLADLLDTDGNQTADARFEQLHHRGAHGRFGAGIDEQGGYDPYPPPDREDYDSDEEYQQAVRDYPANLAQDEAEWKALVLADYRKIPQPPTASLTLAEAARLSEETQRLLTAPPVAAADGQTAAALHEFCRTPLHPGPCEGWKLAQAAGRDHTIRHDDLVAERRARKRTAKPKMPMAAAAAVSSSEIPAPDGAGVQHEPLPIPDHVPAPPGVVAARERQANIDHARNRADLLAELEEVALLNEAPPDVIVHRAEQTARRLGITDAPEFAPVLEAARSGDPDRIQAAIDTAAGKLGLHKLDEGRMVPYDRSRHKNLGSGGRPGQMMHVVRPGYAATLPGGERVQLEKTVVEEATPQEVIAERARISPAAIAAGSAPVKGRLKPSEILARARAARGGQTASVDEVNLYRQGMPNLTGFTLAEFGKLTGEALADFNKKHARGHGGKFGHGTGPAPSPAPAKKATRKAKAAATPGTPAVKAPRKAKAPAAKPKIDLSWLDDDPDWAEAEVVPVEPSGPMATTDQLKAGLKSGIKERQDLSGGQQSHTERVTFSDGTKGVHKKAGAVQEIGQASRVRSGQDQTDADELAGLVAKAFGVTVPHMVRVPRKKDTAVHSLVDGRSGIEMIFDPPPGWDQRDIPKTDDGIRLGFLDMVIENQDRHEGNWMIDRDGKLVAIDHGHAFEPSYFGAIAHTNGFNQHFVDRTGKWNKKNPMSKQDIAVAKTRLEALKPEFDRLGRADWHSRMMDRLAMIGNTAKGTKNLLDAA